jgi:hypothetical protein
MNQWGKCKENTRAAVADIFKIVYGLLEKLEMLVELYYAGYYFERDNKS